MAAIAKVIQVLPLGTGVDVYGNFLIECKYQLSDPALQGDGSGHDARLNAVTFVLPSNSPSQHHGIIVDGIIADAAAQPAPFDLIGNRVSMPKFDGDGVLKKYDVQVVTTGFSQTISSNIDILILEPAGILATGTVTMPSQPGDGQIIGIVSTQTITALTLSAAIGHFILNAITTIAIGGFAYYLYRTANSTWYRVG